MYYNMAKYCPERKQGLEEANTTIPSESGKYKLVAAVAATGGPLCQILINELSPSVHCPSPQLAKDKCPIYTAHIQ